MIQSFVDLGLSWRKNYKIGNKSGMDENLYLYIITPKLNSLGNMRCQKNSVGNMRYLKIENHRCTFSYVLEYKHLLQSDYK